MRIETAEHCFQKRIEEAANINNIKNLIYMKSKFDWVETLFGRTWVFCKCKPGKENKDKCDSQFI